MIKSGETFEVLLGCQTVRSIVHIVNCRSGPFPEAYFQEVVEVIIKIRAHHLLCMQGYQGYGYSDEFQANLERIIKLITTASDIEIEVIAEKDIICCCCPYTGKTGCQKDEESAQRIKNMDLSVLKKLNIKEGKRDKAENLVMLTNTIFKTYFDTQDICGNCQWSEKCLWFQRLLQNGRVSKRGHSFYHLAFGTAPKVPGESRGFSSISGQ